MNTLFQHRVAIYSIFGLLSFLKLIAFHYTTGLLNEPLLMITASLGSLLFIYALLEFFGNRGLIPVVLLSNLIGSLILFADTVYNSYFLTVIPKEALLQMGELQGVGESVGSFIKPIHFTYFADLPIWILVIWLFKKHSNPSPLNFKYRLRNIAVLLVCGAIIWTFVANELKKNDTLSNNSYINLGVINYHVIDLLGLSERVIAVASPIISNNDVAVELQKYRDTIPYHTIKKLEGVAKGKNLLIIQLESFQNAMINLTVDGVEVTPNLNKLIKEGIYFDNFYQENGLGNTADSEFIMNNSMFPTTGGAVYKMFPYNKYRTTAHILKDQGYQTFAFHGYDPTFYDRNRVYPYQGIDTYYSMENLDNSEILGMGISDSSMYRQMIPILKENQPFYSLFVTLSSHHPFYAPPTGFTFEKEFLETTVGRYLNAIRYTDQAVGEMLTLMEKHDLLDNTVIVFYGDHRGITMEDKEVMTKILGREYTDLEMYNVPLIIRLPDQKLGETISIAGGQLDILPTLANIMGFELPAQTMGRDLVNAKAGFVAYRAYLPEGSFIDDNYFFKMPKNYNFQNGECIRISDGKVLPVENCQAGYETAKKLFLLTDHIFKEDLVPKLENDSNTNES